MARPVLSVDVYEALRRRILSGEIPPGAALSEERLATELAVSRTPLREAIRQLAEAGLVAHRPHRGARVNELSPQLAREVFEIREALEGMAARLSAERMPEERIAALRLSFDGLREAVAAGQLQDVGDHIHEEILDACGSDRLRRMIGVHSDQVAWIQSSCYRVDGNLRQAFQTVLPALLGARGRQAVEQSLRRAFREHEGILLALSARDPEWAETAMRAHIRATLKDVLAALASAEAAALDSAPGESPHVPRTIASA
ncbi:MAG: FCD domain-containing protein [Acidobacteria bacterium]|nr:FCD domain-containing protein [Acidobacteriota bacterium]